MPDEQPVESSTTEETPAVTETPAEEQPAAEPQNTETAPKQENMVPSFRLKEEADKRRAAEGKLEELEAKLKAEQPEPEPAPPVNAPDGLDERERVRWYVEHDAGEMIKRELGMTLAEAKAQMAGNLSTSRDHNQAKWERMAGEHNLDHSNKEVQQMVAGLVKMGVSPEDAIARTAKAYATQPAQPATETANVEDVGINPVMTAERVIVKNKQEAMDLARKGIRATHETSEDIIARAIEKERANPQPARRSIS